MFKVGDIIKGINEGSRSDLLKGKVIELADNNDNLVIEVLEHLDRDFIDSTIIDYNSSDLFELFYEIDEKIKLENITCLLNEFDSNNIEINHVKQILERIISNKENSRREFNHFLKEEIALRNKIEELSSDNSSKNELLEKMFQEINLIEEDSKCEKVIISDKKINIYTKQLYIEDEKYPDGHFKMNKYHININLRDLTTLVFGVLDDYNRESFWSQHCPHPHISQNGHPCWGNTSAMLVDSLENRELYTAFLLVINYLETFNIDDTAGKNIKNWDFVSKEDDNNILDNPYSTYNEQLSCGCSVESEDDIYSCEACGDTLCPECYNRCEHCDCVYCSDHSSYLKYVGGYVCDDCKDEYYVFAKDVNDYIKSDDSFICDDCDETFSNNYSNYLEHLDIHVCDDCLDEYYVFAKDVDDYIKSDDSFTCDVCDETFSDDCSNHYTRNDGLDVVVCDNCYQNSYYICEDCDDFIADGDEIYIESQEKYICSNCKENNYTFVEDLDDYVDNYEAFECCECGNYFSINCLNEHTYENNDEILNYCNRCYSSIEI